jgi:hypothetical protein
MLASGLGMRKREAINESEADRINPARAIWVIEGGANRTSVVRRELATQMMQWVYGEADLSEHIVYQLGSGQREIPKQRNDKPNAEYLIAQEIAGNYLPNGDVMTEFDLNLASALQAGYEVDGTQWVDNFGVERVISLTKDRAPQLVLVQPVPQEGGLKDGLSAIKNILGDVAGGQFVVATNGQYRPKDEYQAVEWAQVNGVDMTAPVAIGDEPGYSVTHNGKEIVTAERTPMVYVNEMVILNRLTASTKS